MKTEQEITYRGIKLLVSGEYTEAEPSDRDYPGASSDFTIYKITLEDSEINIFNLFSWNVMNEIEYLTMQEIEK